MTKPSHPSETAEFVDGLTGKPFPDGSKKAKVKRKPAKTGIDVLALRAGVKPKQVDAVLKAVETDPNVSVTVRSAGSGRLKLTKASAIQPVRTTWAWDKYIPLRSLSLIAGPPGLGKTQLQVRLAADMTRGTLAGEFFGKPRPVLMATAEDSLSATMVPRLIAAGANLDLIHFIEIDGDGLIGSMDVAEDLEELRDQAATIRPGLITLDPLVSFIDGIDSHKDQQVRRVLSPLMTMADEMGAAVSGLIHLNKREGHDPLARVSGSGAFVAAARSVMLMGTDRQDEDAVHLVHVKTNLGKRGPSLRCRIEELTIATPNGDAVTSRLLIEGESEARADDLLSAAISADDRSSRDDAVDFLLGELAGGRSVRAKEIQARAQAELGISVQTLNRAKKAAGVKPRQVRDGGDAHWVWEIPDGGKKPKSGKRKGKGKRS